MKIKVPGKVQIGGHSFGIIFDDDLRDQALWGQIRYKEEVIGINPKCPPIQRMDSLTHEVIHMVDEFFMGGQLGEGQVMLLAEGFTQIMVQIGIELDWGDIGKK